MASHKPTRANTLPTSVRVGGGLSNHRQATGQQAGCHEAQMMRDLPWPHPAPFPCRLHVTNTRSHRRILVTSRQPSEKVAQLFGQEDAGSFPAYVCTSSRMRGQGVDRKRSNQQLLAVYQATVDAPR